MAASVEISGSVYAALISHALTTETEEVLSLLLGELAELTGRGSWTLPEKGLLVRAVLAEGGGDALSPSLLLLMLACSPSPSLLARLLARALLSMCPSPDPAGVEGYCPDTNPLLCRLLTRDDRGPNGSTFEHALYVLNARAKSL